MFDSREYPRALDEDQFDLWLEEGRQSKMPFEYMLVLWDEMEGKYHPEYVESREQINKYPLWGEAAGHTSTIAVYDLYSEARITILDH